MSGDPRNDPRDPGYRPPLAKGQPFPPAGEIGHPSLKELLYDNMEPGDLVVDVGCGPGPFEYHRYRADFIAFDAFEVESHEGLVEGRDEFRLGRLETIPMSDGSASAVVMGFILEHVENPLQFLREADRVLKPGGWLYVAVPHHACLEDRLFRLATTVAGSSRGPHIQKFTLQGFQQMTERSTSLRLVAWHRLRASFLWMDHPRLRWARKPFIAVLNCLMKCGWDLYRDSNHQMLFRKAG